jgi:hypothetical protein
MSEGEITSLNGPVEKIAGKLVLRIPLEAGGRELIECSRGISEIDEQFLTITIPEWLSGMLRIENGSLVNVDNRGGKCNIQPVNPLPVH